MQNAQKLNQYQNLFSNNTAFPKTFISPVGYTCSCSYNKRRRLDARTTDATFYRNNNGQELRKEYSFHLFGRLEYHMHWMYFSS